jgi:hypothetical protein
MVTLDIAFWKPLICMTFWKVSMKAQQTSISYLITNQSTSDDAQTDYQKSPKCKSKRSVSLEDGERAAQFSLNKRGNKHYTLSTVKKEFLICQNGTYVIKVEQSD